MNLFITTMTTQTNTYPQKKRRADDSLIVSDDDSSSNYPTFLVVEPAEGHTINISIFGIQKLLKCAVGDVKSAKKLRNGCVLIEVASKAQAESALKMTIWIDTPLKVSAHRSLNTCKGIIRCRDLRDCSEEEVLEDLSHEGVTQVKHIYTKRNGASIPTNTFVLTFNRPVLPKSVKAAYCHLQVEPFIPNPLRCFNCQKFGHGRSSCSHGAVCARCSKTGHTDTDCEEQALCANCSGPHPSYSRECPEWIKQRAIVQLKTEKNLSFGEAKQLYLLNNTPNSNAPSARRAGVLYSQATSKVKTVSVEVQTELSWPLDSKVPVAVTNLISTNTSSSSSQTQSDGAIGGRPKTPTKTNIPHYKATDNKRHDNLKPGPASSNVRGNRPAKGSTDPIKIHNRFGSIDDDMEYEGNSSPKSKHK